MSNLYMFIFSTILFFVLTPGIILTILPKSSKKIVALVHAFVFAVVWHFMNKIVWNLTEGFATRTKLIKPIPIKKFNKPIPIPIKKFKNPTPIPITKFNNPTPTTLLYKKSGRLTYIINKIPNANDIKQLQSYILNKYKNIKFEYGGNNYNDINSYFLLIENGVNYDGNSPSPQLKVLKKLPLNFTVIDAFIKKNGY